MTYDHANSAGSHVPHNASAAVVVLVRHTLVHGTITLDVDVVTQLVGGQVTRQRNLAGLLVVLGEDVASASAVTKGVRHF